MSIAGVQGRPQTITHNNYYETLGLPLIIMRFDKNGYLDEVDIKIKGCGLRLNVELRGTTIIVTNHERGLQMQYHYPKRTTGPFRILGYLLKLLIQSKDNEELYKSLSHLGITQEIREYMIETISDNFITITKKNLYYYPVIDSSGSAGLTA